MEEKNNNVEEGWKMKKFQQHLVEFDFPQIYCDMDGVVADFTKFTADHLGTKFKDDFWSDLPDDLFLQLPKCQMQIYSGITLNNFNLSC